MEQSDRAQQDLAGINAELTWLVAWWQNQQKQLIGELEGLKTDHTALEAKKRAQVALVDAVSMDTYRELRKRKGTAVARIEKGICLGCRITLPNSDLQQAKSGQPVKCSSCGRILYLP